MGFKWSTLGRRKKRLCHNSSTPYSFFYSFFPLIFNHMTKQIAIHPPPIQPTLTPPHTILPQPTSNKALPFHSLPQHIPHFFHQASLFHSPPCAFLTNRQGNPSIKHHHIYISFPHTKSSIFTTILLLLPPWPLPEFKHKWALMISPPQALY